MQLLVVCQYYSPEPFRISDICEELVALGHSVTVLTGLPNYPAGTVLPDYKKNKRRDEVIGGVKVRRCFTIGRRSGAFFRLLNYYSYALSSWLSVSKLKDDFDAVFVYQLSPVMMAKAGIRYKKKYGKKLVLYCLDLWPESLAAAGIKRCSPLYRHYLNLSEKIYQQADKLLVTSKGFQNYLSEHFGIEESKIDYLPQYAEGFFSPKACRKEKDGFTDLLFAGNIGAMQSVDTIIDAAALLKDNPKIRWHIVGDGSEYERCRAYADSLQLKNLTFHGRKPPEEMPGFYSMADAMLVTMSKDPVLSLTLPGKIQSYMAAGKPILGAVDDEAAATIAEAGCGICAAAQDAKGLAEIALRFSKFNSAEEMAQNARNYYEKRFSKESFMIYIVKSLKETADNEKPESFTDITAT